MPVAYIARRRISRNKFIGRSNQELKRCPQADSAAWFILPEIPRQRNVCSVWLLYRQTVAGGPVVLSNRIGNSAQRFQKTIEDKTR